MQINKWLRDTRKRQGLTLQDLSHKAHLNHSQVSRIELGRSELSFFTMVRLMYGLGYSIQDFFELGFVYDLHVPEFLRDNNSVLDSPCFNFGDLEILDLSGKLSKGTAAPIVVKLIDKFIQRYAPKLTSDQVALISPNVYAFLNEDGDYSLINKYLPDFDFLYPKNLSPQILRSVYLSEGVFVIQDLGMYVKQLRLSRSISLRELGQMTGITHTVIESFEKTDTKKNRLSDFLELDRALELKGELIVYAWRVAELYNGMRRTITLRENRLHPWKDSDISFFEKLIVISRFFQHYFHDDAEWLRWYRRSGLSVAS